MSYWESTFSLRDKVILITGASSGIGKQIALDLAETGAKLIITGRDKPRLEQTYKALIGTGHQSIACDLAQEAQIEALARALPPLDGFVHCAGLLSICPISHTERESAEAEHSVNFFSALSLSQKLAKARLLKQDASVVFMSSVAASKPSKGFGVYSASKAALEAFSKVLALEVASLGIRVNCVEPGMVRTPMFDLTSDIITEELMAEHEKLYPLGFADPSDISPAVLFLLSRASAKITGTTLVIDGGFSL